ncbi:MAG: hypothetical protein Q8L92_07150 [Rubrivivax sp.]|nr:hypothetical protein [Rubrivivax sp.]
MNAFAQHVKVTPLGSRTGEFCALDRALVFEDPDGRRSPYDGTCTVRGPGALRLGKIDLVLLSHVHGNPIGDVIQWAEIAAACNAPDFPVRITPNSNAVNITVGKKLRLIVGAEMAKFFSLLSWSGRPAARRARCNCFDSVR